LPQLSLLRLQHLQVLLLVWKQRFAFLTLLVSLLLPETQQLLLVLLLLLWF
jgi:hypothetical protein